MADLPVDGLTRVFFVLAIANTAAPTVAELNAGLALQALITADGLEGFEAETSTIDNTALNSLFNTVTIGRDSYSGTMLTLKKQTVGADTAFTTLIRGQAGYGAIRRDIAETIAWTSGQALEVYPVICGQRRRLKPEGNTLTRWQSPWMITTSPALSAVVA